MDNDHLNVCYENRSTGPNVVGAEDEAIAAMFSSVERYLKAKRSSPACSVLYC